MSGRYASEKNKRTCKDSENINYFIFEFGK